MEEALRLAPFFDLIAVDTVTSTNDEAMGLARRAARCNASGKRRNAAEGPICPTEGRVIWRPGVVAKSL